MFSQRILLELPKKGLSREDAYAIVQRNAMRVWEELQSGDSANRTKNEKGANQNKKCLFLQYLLEDGELCAKMSSEAITECFDYGYYLKNVDNIFKRVFGK